MISLKPQISISFIHRIIEWMLKRVKKEKISPEINITLQENKGSVQNNYSLLPDENNNDNGNNNNNTVNNNDHTNITIENESVPESLIIEKSQGSKKIKSKQKKGPHQKFEVIKNENEKPKEKSKSSKKPNGIIRTRSVYAIPSSTKETKKDIKRREREERKKKEREEKENLKRLKDSQSKQSQLQIWKGYLKTLPSQVILIILLFIANYYYLFIIYYFRFINH